MTRSQNNLNDVLTAETVMMLKEHFIESYGPVRQTTSSGESGGSAMQRLVAANYPGLLDGMMPLWSIPDAWSIISQEAIECPLIHRYFTETSPQLWGDINDRRAVLGMGGASCEYWDVGEILGYSADIFDPRVGCATTFQDRLLGAREPEWVYDPQENPAGVRCAVQDIQAPVFGYRTSDGFANRPVDNVGVQYGLLPLVRGDITSEQFVDLNAKVGGRDIDFNWTIGRSKADVEGLRNAYLSGRIPDYRQLAGVPMIEVRSGVNEEVHQSVHGKMARARLIAANGHAGNQVMWEAASPIPRYETEPEVFTAAFTLLDQWVTAVKADASADSLETKVLRNKPLEAKDACWVAGKPDVCGDSLPAYSLPRMVAGGPLSGDVLKCQLRPIDWNDYPVEFTDAQKDLLKSAFPDGVCDWTKPEIGRAHV